MTSPLFRLYKEAGWHTTANVNPRGKAVLEHNPHVDDILLHEDDSVPNEKLDEHWANLAKGYDRVVNLSGSIEKGLLKTKADEEYIWPKLKRHLACDVNYYDRTLEIGGFVGMKGLNGELFFSPEEERWGRMIREQHARRFLVLWSLSGSSVHKSYPYAELVAKAFLDQHSDAVFFTVGEQLCRLLEFDHPHAKRRSGVWGIRKSFIMTKYSDLVVGPETGVLNAAGCFETPKIVMLSHSSHENLSKHWKNCYPVEAEEREAPCHPCHKLIYSLDECPVNKAVKSPVCMAHLRPEKILNAMEKVYAQWKEARRGSLCR